MRKLKLYKKTISSLLAFLIIFQTVAGFLFLPLFQEIRADQPESLDISETKIQEKYDKSELKEKYKLEKASFIKEAKDKNAIQTEVGDKTKNEFEPELTLRKWDDEVNFKVKYKHEVKKKDQIIELKGDKIKWKGDKTEVHYYEMKKGELLHGKELESDVYEVEVLLLEKPDTNVVEMDIETKGLKFYYQPALNLEDNPEADYCTETDCYKDGEVMTHRPENVVGSYAVYHESKAGDYSQMGKKNYRAGKAFHIYRPKIVDSAGKEVWGELNITDNLLTVEIPQEFLDNAVYPVRHAAGLTFGYETLGGSAVSWTGGNDLVGTPYTSSGSGIGDSLHIGIAAQSGTIDTKGALYQTSDDSFVANSASAELNIDTTKQWHTYNFPSSPSITAQEYWLTAWGSGDYYFYADSVILGAYRDVETYNGFPAFFSKDLVTDNNYSIYATYTVAAPTISSGSLVLDNSYVDIVMSEGVYNTSGGSGALETTDFALTFTQNGGNATAASISAVTKTDGNPLAGGETTVRANLSVTGTPSGAETVEIKPVATSIYNAAGTAMADTETTGAKILNDQLAPTFTAATATTTTITLTFNENVTATAIAGAWTVAGHTVSAASAVTDGTEVTLTLSTTMTTGETPVINYVAATGDTLDSSGNEVADGGAITPSDGVVPVLSSATRDSDTQITVTLSELGAQATITKSNDGGFTVAETGAPGTTYAVSAIAPLVAGNDNEVVLTIADMGVSAKEGITVTYTGGGGPAGTIADAVIDTLEFDTVDGIHSDLIHIAGNVYAIAYRGPDNDGFLKTVTISDAGDITDTVIDTLEFETDYGEETKLIHIAGNVYAIAYRGPDYDGFLKTVTISDAGDITDTVIDTLEFETDYGRYLDFIHIAGNVYAIAYRGPDDDGFLKTVTISDAGEITDTVIDTLEFETVDGSYPDLIHITGNVYAIAYTGVFSSGFLKTVTISDAGEIIDTVIDTLEFDTSYGYYPDLIHISGNVYAIAYRAAPTGFLKTITISDAGAITDTVIDTLEFDTGNGDDPNIIHISGNVYAIAYRGPDADGFLKTVTISDAGAITDTVIDTLEFDTATCYSPNIIHITGNVYAIAYRGTDVDGFLKTVTISAVETYGTVTDVPGNALATDSTGVNISAWDTSAPTVTLSDDHADLIVKDADTVVITATFNENMTSAPTISIDVSTGTDTDISAAAMSGSGTTWTYSWDVPTGHSADTATVTVAGEDIAGNAYVGSDSIVYTIDNIAPTIVITAPVTGAKVKGTTLITFTDDELTNAQCSIDNSAWVACVTDTTTLSDITGFDGLGNGTFTLYLKDTDTAGNIGTDTETGIIKDASTPDIVLIDAGLSSLDRTSLTSDTWFKYSDTGSDNQVSFLWIDPSSPSDDAFYYELNADSGNTITGDESTTADSYIDDISVTEGTNYFHCRPKNGADTWGTEKTFVVKYDKTAPANINISSITADSSSQLTIISSIATDSDSGLHVTPYWFNETLGNSGATDSIVWQSSTSFIDNGLSANTQYTYQVKAKDAVENESSYSTSVSKYTLANIPSSLSLAADSTTQITASWNANSNPANTEYYIENTTAGANSGWTTSVSWISSDLNCGTDYSFKVKSRNGDNTETAYTSIINVETHGCGGGMPPAVYNPPSQPEPTPENPESSFSILINNGDEYANSETVILKLNAGSDTTRMAISNTEDFKYASQIDYREEYQWKLEVESQKFIKSKVKTVYVKFYTQYGVASEVVSDSIILKTTAVEEKTIMQSEKREEEMKPEILETEIPEEKSEEGIKRKEETMVSEPEEEATEPEAEIETATETPTEPEEEIISQETPGSMRGDWNLISTNLLSREFVSQDIAIMAEKFPKLKKVFENLDISKFTKKERLAIAKFNLPGLAEILNLSSFNLSQSILLSEIPAEIKKGIPSDIIFAKTIDERIEINSTLVFEDGTPQQKISLLSGKSVKLIVRPENPVKSIEGYIVFKSRNRELGNINQKDENQKLSLNSILDPILNIFGFASDFAKAQEVEKKLVLSEFEYTDPDQDGIWTADIQLPKIAGEYEILTIMDYQDFSLKSKAIKLIAVIDPEGYVYRMEADGIEARIPGAIVSIYRLNPANNQYELWPASEYQQQNPQTTDNRGTYSFLVPEGAYYLKVEAEGYRSYQEKPFEVKQGPGVHINIELKTETNLKAMLTWERLFLIVFGIALFYNFYRDRKRKKTV